MLSSKFRSALRRYGLAGLFRAGLQRILRTIGIIWIRNELYRKACSAPEKEVPPYRELVFADFERQAAFDPQWFTPIRLQQIARRFRVPETTAFGCFDGEQLIAYGWLSGKYMGYSKQLLPAGDGYLWDDYTHPDYRGQGLHTQIIRIRNQELYKRGLRYGVGMVRDFNRASRRGFEQAGYTLFERSTVYGFRGGKLHCTRRYGKAAPGTSLQRS